MKRELIGPEGVALSFPLASRMSRAMAFFVDIGIIMATTGVLGLLALLATVGVQRLEPLAGTLVAGFVIRYAYFAYFEHRWHGSTPGKRLFRLKVVSRDGAPLDGDAIIARNMMRDVEFFLPLMLLAAPQVVSGSAPLWLAFPTLLWIVVMAAMPLLNRDRARAGDLLGNTLVIELPRAPAPTFDTARTRTGSPLFSKANLEIYGEHELEELARILRITKDSPADQQPLELIAKTIRNKVGYDGPELPPEEFLQAFYTAQRAHLEQKLLLGYRKADKHSA